MFIKKGFSRKLENRGSRLMSYRAPSTEHLYKSSLTTHFSFLHTSSSLPLTVSFSFNSVLPCPPYPPFIGRTFGGGCWRRRRMYSVPAPHTLLPAVFIKQLGCFLISFFRGIPEIITGMFQIIDSKVCFPPVQIGISV